jgi:hypothetical protein
VSKYQQGATLRISVLVAVAALVVVAAVFGLMALLYNI